MEISRIVFLLKQSHFLMKIKLGTPRDRVIVSVRILCYEKIHLFR